ncbi:MAG TPA: ATP-binding protein [Thermoanaerobaculia bacterium]|nr:ATP-binding protein [Thermoanaerobaculia bacterium]
MSDLVVLPEAIEARKKARAHRLAVRDIPTLRIVGCSLICVGVFLNNRFILGEPSMRAVWVSTAVAVVYCTLSWLALRAWYDRLQPFDLSLFFLTVDVPLMTIAVYLSGAERSWLFFVLLVRTADQALTTFRRCLAFVIFSALCYGAMGAWVVLVDGRPIAMNVFLAKVILIFMVGLYVALTARTAEEWRASRSAAIRISRDLIRQIEERSAELNDARARAEEASAAKSEFLAHMSHEMRTPLHGVIGMLQLAIEDETSPRRARHLELAKRSAESLLATIEDILDFSKIEARKIELEPVYFSIRDLVAETMKPLGVSAATKDLILAAGVAAEVPESVWGDPLRLRQIIVNLVGNAIKFTNSGEVALRVSMTDERMRFEVRDTGIGIPEDQRRTIFEPFAQADRSHSRRHGGTGLGLAIVSRLVDAMGGTVRLQSTPGVGTSVAIDLALPFDRFSSGPRRIRPELTGRSVVVVEPNATSRGFLVEILRSAGLEVTACATVAEIEARKYACAISADEAIAIQPAVIITSPLDVVAGDDRIRVTRPVSERELLDAVATAVGTKPAEVQADDVRTRVARSGLHILVAEDEAVSQEFAAEALRRMMHRVTVVGDGEEALRRLEHHNFDLVFMDVQMPKLDGLEATRRYRERERGSRTPIVALTAHSRREDRVQCLEAGMDAVLTKPIDLKQLEYTVRLLTGAEPIVNAVGGNLALLARVSGAFAKQTPVLLTQIRDAIQMSDAEALYQSAHKMKGAVSNFEGDPSVDLSVMLETAARENDFSRAAALLQRLESAVTALQRRISAAASYPSSSTATPSSMFLR